MSKVPKKKKKRSLLSFSNILRKGIAFVFYCDANHPHTLLDSSHAVTTCIESDVSQESELIKLADSFAFWYRIRKANVNLVITGWPCS